jgi:cell division protein FtsZ
MKFDVVDSWSQKTVIKVIGVGGGGCNAVDHMVNRQIGGILFLSVDTDALALRNSQSRSVMPLSTALTEGLGTGGLPDVGRQAALDSRERLLDVLDGADMVFIIAGLGGGTGTGAAPVIAEIAKETGILTLAVVTKPFPFEGTPRRAVAEKGINELSRFADSLIVTPCEKLLPVSRQDGSQVNVFAAINDMLLDTVRGITDLITHPGLIGFDFADARMILSEMGMAMVGVGVASGPNRGREAAEKAVASPLMDGINLYGARGFLVNITGGHDLSLSEFDDVSSVVHEFASADAIVGTGISIDSDLHDELRVTVVATGLAGPWQRTEMKDLDIPEFLRRQTD